MMTNPAAAMRMLITYAICIPLAIFIGFLLTNQMDYGTLSLIVLALGFILSPIFIKWHYPIMVFGLAFPAYLFFFIGRPPCWEIVVMLSLGIAIVERTINSDKRFIRVPSMTWPMIYTLAMMGLTAMLTGGFGLHQLGGEVGGGKKYITAAVGVITYFALTSRRIPREHWKFYVGLYFLSALPSLLSDAFPYLPSPLNYINLLFPPSRSAGTGLSVGIARLGAVSTSVIAVSFFLLARHGLRGMFSHSHPFRAPLFMAMFVLSMLGGYRSAIMGNLIILFAIFFLEGMHRTRYMLVAILGVFLAVVLLVPFARDLPLPFQRSLAFLPLEIDSQARMEAEGSSEWRLQIWRDLWPKVPSYLLLGKGYLLKAEDFVLMGGVFANGINATMDKSNVGLAVSGDYHNGPLSTLIPFGIWGAIALLWVNLAGVRILYRNFKYGDPELRTINVFLLAWYVQRTIMFFFIFGGFELDIGLFARTVGFSVALNWGMCGPKPQPAPVMQSSQCLPRPMPA